MHFGIHLPHAGDRATPALIPPLRHPGRGAGVLRRHMGQRAHHPPPHPVSPARSRRSTSRSHPHLGRRDHRARASRHLRAGAANATPDPSGEGTGDAAEPLQRPPHPWRRRRPGSPPSSPRSAPHSHERGRRMDEGIAPDARRVEPGPGDLPHPIHPGRNRRHDHDGALPDHADPAVDRRQLRRRARSRYDPHRRRLARLARNTGADRGDRAAPARRTARPRTSPSRCA